MKSFCILILSIFLAFSYSFSQKATYFAERAETHFEKMPSAIYVSDSSTILTYVINEAENKTYPVIVRKTESSEGSLELFNSYFMTMISRIFCDDQFIYFIGKSQASQVDSVKLFVLKTDYLLSPVDTVFIKPFLKNLLYFQVCDTFPEIKVIYTAESTIEGVPKSIYSISFSLEGDILSHQQAPIECNTVYLSYISSTPEGKFAVNGYYSIQGAGGTMHGTFFFNDSLTFQNFWKYPITEIFGIPQNGILTYSNTNFISEEMAYVTARAYLADTLIIIPQNYHYYIKAMLADTAGNVYKVNAFGAGDTTLYPAFAKHQVATEGNYLYVVWTKNIEVGCFPYCPFNSWIAVTYLNDSLDIVWEKFIGGDDFYTSHIAEASPEGGIVIAGTRYRYNDPGQPHEVFIVSVSEEGVVTGTSTEHPMEIKQAIVYPNPGNGMLTVETGSHIKSAEFSLFDLNGRKVLSTLLNDKVTGINTEKLPPGVYLYSISNTGFNETGKWIKQ